MKIGCREEEKRGYSFFFTLSLFSCSCNRDAFFLELQRILQEGLSQKRRMLPLQVKGVHKAKLDYNLYSTRC